MEVVRKDWLIFLSRTVYRTGRLTHRKGRGGCLGIASCGGCGVLYFLSAGITSLGEAGIWFVVRTVPEVVVSAQGSV